MNYCNPRWTGDGKPSETDKQGRASYGRGSTYRQVAQSFDRRLRWEMKHKIRQQQRQLDDAAFVDDRRWAFDLVLWFFSLAHAGRWRSRSLAVALLPRKSMLAKAARPIDRCR